MSGEKTTREFELDPILDEIGHFGKFQLLNYVLIVVPIIFNAFFTLSYVFTAADDPHRCRIEECEERNSSSFDPYWLANAIPHKNKDFDQCHRFQSSNESFHWNLNDSSSCEDYNFNTNVVINCKEWLYKDGLSIVHEFNLGCQSWKRTLIGTLNNVGQFVCLPLTGLVSDRFGRRVVLVGGAIISGVIGTIRSFSPSYLFFCVMEFLDSALGSGIFSAAFILGIELVGPKQRVAAGAIISSFYAIGEVILGGIAWQVPYWRHLLRFLYIPSCVLVFYFWIVPESVRWSISKGKIQQAKDTLTRAARINGTALTEKSLRLLDEAISPPEVIAHDKNLNESKSQHEPPVRQSSFVQIVKSPTMMVRLTVCSFWWITCTFVYYGLSLNSVAVAGTIYLNLILVALVEIPAYLTTAYVTDRFGRKYSLSVSYLGSGIACLAFIFLPEEMYGIRTALYLAGKFCITVSFSALYVYTSELYPTPLRHSLLGTCSMFGRIGSIVAPQTPLLASIMKSLPLILFGGTAILAGLLVLPFPETLNCKLPDTIEEAENLSRSRTKKV